MSKNRRLTLCLALVILSASLSTVLDVNSTSGHIVINEFDQNPPGHDNYLSVEEWIELHNPTSEDVDIGSWTLSTTHGETVTVTIPDGTVIDAYSYYVVSRGSQWLDNDDEAIILRDAVGNEIDRTPARSDDDNSDSSWARYPDGQDSDSNEDWRYQASTKDGTNGGGSSPDPEPEPAPAPEPEPEPEPAPEPEPESEPAPSPTPPSTPLTENVTVHFIDVGQGDSIFVDTPSLDMLIDGGSRSEGETVLGYLQALNITRIDYVVGTHPHADHIGGLITVLSVYHISEIPIVIDSGFEATTQTYEDYIESVGQRTLQLANRGSIIPLGHGVNVTILNPTQPLEFDDSNDNSIVLRLQVQNITFLLTGDSEGPSEASILSAGYTDSCTIMKVGHHGSRTSTSSEYLEAIDPEIAVICVGEGNRYNHPHDET
ncbi:lamin tail domain-containing protein, partial [Candidatus Bathyarchaeota archaeon]|nr:lamin tail domain-containing protein [Candidatus Bathyarchaeota archaeon]